MIDLLTEEYDKGFHTGLSVGAPWLVYHQEAIQLHSGGWSHFEVRGDIMFANEPLRASVLDCWMRAIKWWYTDSAQPRVYGVPRGGTPWAEALAERLGVEPLSTYQVADDAGPTFIVDDVTTTGKSLKSYPEPKLVVVRRGEVQVAACWADMMWLPVFKEKPVS